MELINNTTKTLKDDLSVEIKQGSKLSIAAACFSIYAFQELKEQLSQIEELRFIFTSPTFVTEKAKKERREFYIPRLTRERNLYGTEFEIKLRNELTQKAIARECAEWIRQKVTFKSNVSDKSIQGQIVVDGVGYTPINNFTTVELGCEKGNVISTTIVKDESLARTLLADFNEIWNDSKVLQVVTDVLMQEISCKVVDGNEERYQFTWPDKKKSVLLANAPINKTLRPVRENETVPTGADSEGKPYCSTGSVDFDTTENLYIEGDNLEVLKLLQETYLGKIKMIYIDPPYNTGNDFVYNDEFGIRSEEWNGISGNYDADGNQIVGALERNTEANGRFHTDWLNMLYPRLKLAKDLLRDDGVIFISIDDNEVENLKKVCGEVFGEGNFVAIINWKGRGGRQDSKYYAAVHEYILCYAKQREYFVAGEEIKSGDVYPKYDKEKGRYYKTQLLRKWGSNSRREDMGYIGTASP